MGDFTRTRIYGNYANTSQFPWQRRWFVIIVVVVVVWLRASNFGFAAIQGAGKPFPYGNVDDVNDNLVEYANAGFFVVKVYLQLENEPGFPGPEGRTLGDRKGGE